MKYRLFRILAISVSIIIVIQSIGFCQESNIPRLKVSELKESFASVYVAEETDSAGFDAMVNLGKSLEGEPIEIIGNLDWHRPYYIKAESEEKDIPDMTFGDFYIPVDCIVFYFDEWLNLYFHEDYVPYVGPTLEEYGLDKSMSDYFPFDLPREFVVTLDDDTLKFYPEVVIRGIVSIDWKRGLRTKHEPMKSISLKDCQIVRIIQTEE